MILVRKANLTIRKSLNANDSRYAEGTQFFILTFMVEKYGLAISFLYERFIKAITSILPSLCLSLVTVSARF